MERMTPEALALYANIVFAGERELVKFNLVYEVHNGLLIAEVLEGDADAATSERHMLAAAFACAMVGGGPRMLAKVFEIAADPDATMMALAERIDALPIVISMEEKGELQIQQRPPVIAAAFVAAQDPDGKPSYLLYRHPEVDRDRAIIILKAVLRAAGNAALEADTRKFSGN